MVDKEDGARLTPETTRKICDRHFGLGSDGILVGARKAEAGVFSLRILNSDGTEAEKSGNGIRIYAKHLWDARIVDDRMFTIGTLGGPVRCQVQDSGKRIFVEMGQASFESEAIPMLGPKREVVGEALSVADDVLKVTALTVGNPHCVVHVDEPTPEMARRIGPLIENHPRFPRRANVQFVKVLGAHRLRIEIWERGAGYTLASGSSACAAAAASVRLGHCRGEVTVVMPGGELLIDIGPGFSLTMVGPAARIAWGEITDELLLEDAR